MARGNKPKVKGKIVSPLIVKNVGIANNLGGLFNKLDIARMFYKKQPFYYDKSGLFYFWDNNDKYWEQFDETELLISINKSMGINTIDAKERGETIQAIKQVGRENKPLDFPKSYIQFKDNIIDLSNPNKCIPASSKYFCCNPIPWKIGKSEATPNMDKIFADWVGKDYVETLYQIIAYSLIQYYPIHRIFCLNGAGLNGKSKYLELLRKFVGQKNCCATELDILLMSRFEVTRLHKKLVCQMGETNFNEISRTSILKKLTGGDLIGYEYKNKTPFEELNYAKIIISTNNLPATTDKTIGFYRRWMIIDFPNQFTEKIDILSQIPDVEYKNLAKKSIRILKNLLTTKEFHNEGSIEERIKRYEEKSNYLEVFLKKFTVKNEFDGYTIKSTLHKKFSDWCKEKGLRYMSEQTLGTEMNKLGYKSKRKWFDWADNNKGGQIWVWEGIVLQI